MKVKEFDLLITQVEKEGDSKLKNDRAIGLLEKLRRLSSLYNPIMFFQFEKRLLNCTIIDKENKLPSFTNAITLNDNSNLVFTQLMGQIKEFDHHDLQDKLIEMDSVNYVNIFNCHRCIFNIKNIENSALIRNCTGCDFRLSTKQLRISGSRNCKFNIKTSTEPVIEDSLELTFSPLVTSEDNKWNRVRDFSCKPNSYLLIPEHFN
jgi:hypothetical protein